ncbi:hypothetical protein JWJ90_00090 [Desulfobulbus rhabdoformis]|uniref:hypothetical protein n=1 Tax=Desulfobulbus rhabdoformis TaxID=34032 RepID=UPI00196296FB|nr:hypothetical protein [Desulfobulbus rhabdoformis]MBM9612678.1 hypothetical protein [Desulfobulbus rhabdoformis]
MKKIIVTAALGLMLSLPLAAASFAGSVGEGNFNVYKGGHLADKLAGQNPIEDGAFLVCDGKCMIKSEGISLVAADKAKLAVRNEAKCFNLFLREGRVNYTITSKARQIAFHTPQGTYTSAEVIFNAASNPVVKGYAKVNADGSTEIGVEEGRLVFATAEGMKTVDANQKIVLAVSELPPGSEGSGIVGTLTNSDKIALGAGALVTGGTVLYSITKDASTNH